MSLRLRWFAAKKWARLLWPRFCRYVVVSAQHPGLVVAQTYQSPSSPWEITGFLNGQKVRLTPDTGAKARMAYDGLTQSNPAGWVEFRQSGVVRSRYVSPPTP